MQLTEEQRAELTARKTQLEQIRQALLDDANRKLAQLEGALVEVARLLNNNPEISKVPDTPQD